jgi:hypothetical protein
MGIAVLNLARSLVVSGITIHNQYWQRALLKTA